MDTEELMHFISVMTKGEDFCNEGMILKFKEGLKKFKLSKELLDRLEAEEEIIYQTSEKHIIVKPKIGTEFMFYFKHEGRYYVIEFLND